MSSPKEGSVPSPSPPPPPSSSSSPPTAQRHLRQVSPTSSDEGPSSSSSASASTQDLDVSSLPIRPRPPRYPDHSSVTSYNNTTLSPNNNKEPTSHSYSSYPPPMEGVPPLLRGLSPQGKKNRPSPKRVQSNGVIHYGTIGGVTMEDSESEVSSVESSEAPSVNAALTYALPSTMVHKTHRTQEDNDKDDDDEASTRTPIPMAPPSQSFQQILPSSFLRTRTSQQQHSKQHHMGGSSASSLSDLSDEEETLEVKRHKREEMNVGRLVLAAKQQQNFAQMWFMAGRNPEHANALPAMPRNRNKGANTNTKGGAAASSLVVEGASGGVGANKIRFQEPPSSSRRGSGTIPGRIRGGTGGTLSGPIDLDSGEVWNGNYEEEGGIDDGDTLGNDSKKNMEVGNFPGFHSTTHSAVTPKRSNRRFISFGVPDDEDLTYLTERKGLDRIVCVVGHCRVTLLALVLILVGLCAIVGAAVIYGWESTRDKPTLIPTKAPSDIPSASPTLSPRPSASPSFAPSVSLAPSSSPSSSPTFFYSSTRFDQVGLDLKFSDGADYKNYGYSVTLTNDGQTMAVSAPGPIVLDNPNIEGLPEEDRKGYVVVYQRGDSGKSKMSSIPWIPIGSVLEGRNLDSRFGDRLELSDDGKILAVSERLYLDPLTQFTKESVRVFQYDDTAMDWIPMGTDLSGTAPNQFFGDGLSLSADGKRLVVGSPNNFFERGQVTVFEYDEDAEDWFQIGNHLTGLEAFNDKFGYDVSISADGNVVACGGPGGGPSKAGYVRIYEWDNEQELWTVRGDDIVYLSGEGTPVAAEFGSSLSISGDGKLLIVGAPSSTVDNLSESGHASVWRFGNENFAGIDLEEKWFQIGEDLTGNPTRFQKLGSAVSISRDGRHVATGAPSSDFFRGLVLVSRWNGDIWDSADPLIGDNLNEDFGHDVVLTEGGNYLAVGAPGTSSFFRGGLSRVFEWKR